MRKTKRQLVAETEEWVGKNPEAYGALVRASAMLSDKGASTPFKFLAEVMRHAAALGPETMYGLVDALTVRLSKGSHAIPNQIVSGVARMVAKELDGHSGFHAEMRRSRFDEDDEPEQPSLFQGVAG